MKSTSRFGRNKKGTTCLNCEKSISEENNFCPNCGQVNDTNPISLKQYFSEYLSGFFAFDNRFLKTIIPLLFKPGQVSTAYVSGKRKSYVNPFQLYLNVTIFFFLIQGLFSTIDQYKVKNTQEQLNIPEINEENTLTGLDSIKSATLTGLKKIDPNKDLSQISVAFDSVKTTIQDASSKNDSINHLKSEELNIYIDSVITNSDYLEQLNSAQFSKKEKDSIFNQMFEIIIDHSLIFYSGTKDVVVEEWDQISDINELKSNSLDYLEKVFLENKIDYEIPAHYRFTIEDTILKKIFGEKFFTRIYDFLDYDTKNKDVPVNEALDALGYDQTYRNTFYYSKAQNINKFKNDAEFRESYKDNIISKISVALFFLLPIFTIIVALLYIRNKYNYTEHLVFVFHVQTAFFILLMFFMSIDRLFKTNIGLVFFFLIFLFYIYKALRNFYQQGWFKTIIKYILLNSFFLIIAAIGGIIISFIAFLI